MEALTIHALHDKLVHKEISAVELTEVYCPQGCGRTGRQGFFVGQPEQCPGSGCRSR